MEAINTNNDNNDEENLSSMLVVFFEGTANTIQPVTTQIGLFAKACRATDVTSSDSISNDVVQESLSRREVLKMSFDGCGVTDGIKGTLFAAGLDKQCKSVLTVVKQMIKFVSNNKSKSKSNSNSNSNINNNNNKNNNNIHLTSTKPLTKVRVVAVGLSRGGIALLKLALKLSSSLSTEEANVLSLSMLVFDPVAGNAVTTGFPYTAMFSQDLRCCENILDRVLAIYPYEPLPAIAMHAPSLVIYPSTTNVEEDVSLGCHQGALFGTSPYGSSSHEIASNLSFRRILDFLLEENVPLQFSNRIYQPSAEHCVEICRNALKESVKKSTRITHDKTGMRRKIIRRESSEEVQYLNKHHRQLETTLMQLRENKNTRISTENSTDNKPQTYQLDFEDGNVYCSPNLGWS